jgi:hypothetical protein
MSRKHRTQLAQHRRNLEQRAALRGTDPEAEGVEPLTEEQRFDRAAAEHREAIIKKREEEKSRALAGEPGYSAITMEDIRAHAVGPYSHAKGLDGKSWTVFDADEPTRATGMSDSVW